jgi:HAD superfamily hydrolase (TIGR01549 family)
MNRGLRTKAATFDLWNTLIVRPSGNIAALRARRLANAFDVPGDVMYRAVLEGHRIHEAAWRAGRCWGASGLCDLLVARLGLADDRSVLLRAIEESGFDAGERVVDGAADALSQLHSMGIPLGVVSDSGISPGRVLRRLLTAGGLMDYLVVSALAFSDEVGVPKPHPRMFQAALAGLGPNANTAATVHIGDRRATDIAGARAIGMRTVRFIGCYEDTSPGPEADVVVTKLNSLPELLSDPHPPSP